MPAETLLTAKELHNQRRYRKLWTWSLRGCRRDRLRRRALGQRLLIDASLRRAREKSASRARQCILSGRSRAISKKKSPPRAARLSGVGQIEYLRHELSDRVLELINAHAHLVNCEADGHGKMGVIEKIR